MNVKERFYIAYGSNLNLDQMKHRCPTAEIVGAAELKNLRLWFRGGAHSDIVRELCLMAKNPRYHPSQHLKGKPGEVELQYLLEDLRFAVKLQKYQRRFSHLYRLGYS